MAERWLVIDVDRPGPVRCGGKLTGRLVYTSSEAGKISGSSVKLFWRTSGHADVDHGMAQVVEGGAAELVADEELAIPFEFDVPMGPPSTLGMLLSIEWVLSARLDLPWAIDVKSEHLVHVDPVERTPAPPTGYRGAPEAPPTVSQLARPERGLGWIRNKAASARLGPTVIELPEVVRRGEEVPVTVVVTPEADLHVEEVTATITCTETTSTNRKGDRSTVTHALHHDRLVLAGLEDLARGTTATWTGSFPIPLDVPPSFRARNSSFVWTVAVRVAVKGWPDHEDTFEIQVLP